ncbi:MAG: DAK2 domain-containing protein [Lachnospiraceae bacterium]|nr:DAK2 domain-containing protein [Lachnospiraceae bacterium]MCI9600838.1 DAK2 domain-containing protein [Lachnospiraceae bacterium]
MVMKTIDAQMVAKMFLGGAKNLESKKEWINELNVFPVPDGDTGTNMTLTITAAAGEVGNLEELNMETLAKCISSGSLRGARGNSGVILSQLLRGFTKGIKDQEELDVIDLANAMQKAVETAYKAVMKPKEGTILTVAKGAALKAAELAQSMEDMEEFCRLVIEEAQEVLSRTPDMLPVLKEAGVVDSGGQGLVEVLKGCYDALLGKEVDYSFETPKKESEVRISARTEAEIRFGYCTEFIIMLEKAYDEKTELEFKAFLESIGDSIVVVSDDDIVKVHVHTNDPGLAIQRALTYGALSRMKIDNMRLEHEEKLIKDASRIAAEQKKQDEAKKAEKKEEPRKEMGFISVSIGEGVGEIFKGLGVDYLIEGGQTMNPSTEDMLEAISQVNADHIFILPNNKNIILAANQAGSLTSDKHVIVIPTKTVPQGITAMVNYIPEETPGENELRMQEEIQNVKTGQVTYAVRDTKIDDKEIHLGDIMGIGDDGILAVGKEVQETALSMMEELVDADSEIIGVYYGEEVSEEDAQALGEKIAEKYPNTEVEVHYGGQPIYYYVVSVE